jgi:hypothetical protein
MIPEPPTAFDDLLILMHYFMFELFICTLYT